MTGGASGRPYDLAAAGWLAGAEPAYRRFADALVAASPEPLVGKKILDIGAGTGAASWSLLAAGAMPVAVDESSAMLRTARSVLPGLPAVVCDATALPFADGRWDAAVSAFCINHLEHPARLLREASRVVRAGGLVLASTYEEGDNHPAKGAVDAVLRRTGWEPSSWDEQFHQQTSALTATPERLAAVAEVAGLDEVHVRRIDVDSGLRTPAELVGWRFAKAELAPYLASLSAARRAELARAAAEELGADPPPLVRTVLVLVARSPQRTTPR